MTIRNSLSNALPRTAQHRQVNRSGFTLVELLTVISIIGILTAILIPTIGLVQVHARKAKSTSNLQSIGHAILLYTQANNDLLPAPTYGESNTARSAPGSSNPKQGTWLEELVPLLEGTVQHTAGSTAVTIVKWPDALTDPQYVANNGVITQSDDQDKRGYGMMTKLYLGDKTSPHYSDATPTQRQSVKNIKNQGNTIIIGTSNDVTMEPGDDGTFPQSGSSYSNGDPNRYEGYGLFLFLDGSVQPMNTEDLRKTLANPNSN